MQARIDLLFSKIINNDAEAVEQIMQQSVSNNDALLVLQAKRPWDSNPDIS